MQCCQMPQCGNCKRKSTSWDEFLRKCQTCHKVCRPRGWDGDRIEKFTIELGDDKELGHVAVYGEGANQLVAVGVPQNGNVVIYDVWTKEEKKRISMPSRQGNDWNHVALAYSADGSLYVGDVKSDKIYVFSPDPDFELKYSFGGRGAGAGQFNWPESMAFTSQGYLLVSDYENGRVQVLREKGEFVRFLEISPGNHTIDRPTDVCVASSGHILVASLTMGLLVFDSNFQYVGELDVPDQESAQSAQLKGIHSAAVSFDGTVVVANDSRVKVFRKLLNSDSERFKVTGEAEKPVIEPSRIGTDISDFRVVVDQNVRVDNNGNIFTAKGHDIIKIRYLS